MSWAAGDKAACVRVQPWRDHFGLIVDGPVKGTIYLVDQVFERANGLSLAGWSGWWDADEFRKLIPASERIEVAIPAQIPTDLSCLP